MKRRQTWIFLAMVLLLGGCGKPAGQEGPTAGQSGEAVSRSVSETQTMPIQSLVPAQTTETVNETEPEEIIYQPRLMIASDLHYLAQSLEDRNSQGFLQMAARVDGRAVSYSRQITDAFLKDVIQTKPDLLILAGDLTMEGEAESHRQLAASLEELLQSGISVAVIPGNHDINNMSATGYGSQGAYPVDGVTAGEFAAIYEKLGYGQAIARDENSLSYVYPLDENYWILMLDTCQYDPVNLVGGYVSDLTYQWLEQQLVAAWDEGVQLIPVSHHNLLEQSGVSKAFYDNCTIEHDEKLIEMLSDFGVTLYLSGHLHIQHAKRLEAEEGLYEIVTSSLSMYPFQYGVLDIYDTGNMIYQTEETDVSGWARAKGLEDQNLLNFSEYGEKVLYDTNYRQTEQELRAYAQRQEAAQLALTEAKIRQMSLFYARVCRYYFAGNMYLVQEELLLDPAYEMWLEYGHASERSDFLINILEAKAWDFQYLEIEF